MPEKLGEPALRRLIVKACRALSQRFLVAATDGNVSARVGTDRFLVTPSYVAKGEVTAGSLLVCDAAGRKVRGAGTVTSEVQVHLAAYRARPDAGGVVHAHPPVASAFMFAGCEDLLRVPLIPEVVGQLGSLPCVPYHTPGSAELAAAAEPFFREAEVLLLDRHGAVACGPDPWRAYLRMEKLEHAAVILKAALELAGSPERLRRLSPEELAGVLRSYGKG